MGKPRVKPNYRRRVLRLPDLDHCKTAVLNSLGSPASRRVYEYAIDQFIAWYCSEPRLAFNRIVVVRYRLYLESRHLAANTINQQLAAVRRLAHEAADAGLLSPELAAGISRVKGVKQLGFRSGNWLSAEQSSEVLKHAGGDTMRAKRDYAMLAMLFGCGFRRSELVGLELDDIQMRQGHWAVIDLIGKGGHIRTVPIPNWVKAALDQWTRAAGVCQGKIFRAVARRGKVWGSGLSQNVVWYVVRTCCERAGLAHIAPHDLRRTCAKLCHDRGVATERDHPGGHLIEHCAVGKEVGAAVKFFPLRLLRRHVSDGAQCEAGAREVFLIDHGGRSGGSRSLLSSVRVRRKLRQSKIENLGVAAISYEDIRRFDVAVDDSFGMRRVQSIRDLDG